LKIHEYQGKAVLSSFGVPVPKGKVAYTVAEAVENAKELGLPVVVKAQIHAGGRGKAGGVKLARSPEDARAAASAMLGAKLVTHQTGPQGQTVRRVWVEEGSEIEREAYLAVAIDREQRLPVVMACSEGGMDIEEVAARSPEKILRAAFSPTKGLAEADALRLAGGLGLPEGLRGQAAKLVRGLARAFVELDCSLAEINPLVATRQGRLVALDAKINLDDNALFRHPDLAALRDLHEEEPLEVEASRHGLNYIKLDGEIGCMVNGAGLAMATMDVIKLYGSEPANFLDVGGGATAEQVSAAFHILLADPNTQAVLVNIFGGIMKCDVIAEGILSAAREMHLDVPLVVRLEGTNVEQGRKILEGSKLPIVTAKDLDDAAQKACEAARQRAGRVSPAGQGAQA